VGEHPGFLDLAKDVAREYVERLGAEVQPLLFPKPERGTVWRAWGPPGIVGVFCCTSEGDARATDFESSNLDPFPGLLTTKTRGVVAVDVKAERGFFASNRAEIGAQAHMFRVFPGASFTLWQHVQAFRRAPGKHVIYSIPLAFVLGVKAEEHPDVLMERLVALIDHTVAVRKQFQGGDE
jgi:hypothetical protein